ncbi:MAG: PqqD family protein [Polyangiaceae bacterium]|nr:PqqD family protein [Polyangiaceae bacterium]
MTEAVSPDVMVVVTGRHVACSVDGEVVILHLEDGVYYGLNAVGTRVWELVQSPQPVGHIVDRILEEFDVERERCVQDVSELISALASRGLVECSR